jgi:hypothetical protein
MPSLLLVTKFHLVTPAWEALLPVDSPSRAWLAWIPKWNLGSRKKHFGGVIRYIDPCYKHLRNERATFAFQIDSFLVFVLAATPFEE